MIKSWSLISLIIISISVNSWQPATENFSSRVCDEEPWVFMLKPEAGLQIGRTMPDFGPDGLKGLTESQRKRIMSGEVVLVSAHEEGPEGQTIISAALVFEVAVEQAYAILAATELQAEYLEEIEELKVVERGPNFNRMFFLVKIMGQRLRYTVIHHFVPGEFYFWWELDRDQPHDLRELYGYWKLFRFHDSRTLARYGSYVKPAFPVPAFIRNWLARSNVRSSLAVVKRYVEGKNWGRKPPGTGAW